MSKLPIMLAAALLAAGCSQPPIEQPISFNHNKHIEADVECSECHQYFETSRFSGLPEIEVCTDCHEDDESESAGIKILLGYIERQENIPWKRVYDVADHVFYSHRRHVVSAGLPCAGCHGDIAALSAPPPHPLVDQTMAWCLDCHERSGQTTDCIQCHR